MLFSKRFSLKKKVKLFGFGEWLDEPDDIGFNHQGITCHVMRHSDGFLIGFCDIPKNHPWNDSSLKKIEVDLYGNKFVFKTMDADYIGFSCDTVVDLIPSRFRRLSRDDKKGFTYKNVKFVTDECCKLADQMIEAQIRI